MSDGSGPGTTDYRNDPWHTGDHFIDGEWRPSTGTGRIEVVNPATGEAWASVPVASTEDLDAAMVAARRAFDEGPWPRMAPSERAGVLLRFADEVEARAEALSATNTRENGSPVAETGGAAANAAGILRYFATLAGHLEREDVRPFPHGGGGGSAESVVRRDPLGVCALIAPWNFPINLVVIKLAPALLAGNTVVIKPASPTPLSIRHIVEAAAAAGVPPGVVNLVTGNGRTGDAMVRHPQVDKVAFTGSTEVGRRIAAACGELLRPVTLELGGKSAAILLDDVDLDAFARVFVRSCMRNSGQTCYISTRILAPRSRYEEIVARITEVVAGAPQGDPFEPGTVFGPVANRAQYDSVLDHLASARAEGARFATGGDPLPGPGFFIAPTVLADVSPEMRVAREEIFGPVVTIQPYGDLDEAIGIANSTPFGLGGIVFSVDEQRAFEVAERIDSGSVGINFFASNHAAPFGGRHDSGMGVEYGIEGLEQYIAFKSIHRRAD
ncbi:aldehyde dehydrogenase family protein [Leucobacter soli]|uniref:Geranial dehydrogenase n=1 Tax=Leucobacter soli TaxID=2812850 RepID=A0A916JZ24_9MICO|nr:aldehyde dehydrogenase family protein [Leucobacter soli]CAG7611850.1 Geranial dehydrogenase [Leucobacter soli]